MTEIPVPIAYRAEWFPAAVRLPDRPDPIRVARVWATAEGLYVYTQPPADRHTNRAAMGEPDFYSTIDYDKTPKPSTNYAARQKGIHIVTAAGDVTIQRLAGCGCSYRTLKNWRPSWASRNEAWEVGA